MKNSDCVALILSGGQRERTGVPTKKTPKPAVFFGGIYRPIDFALSNCKHSGIGVTGIITHYCNRELADYIGSGREWLSAREDAEITTLPQKPGYDAVEFCWGTAAAIWNNYEFIEHYNPENILVLPGYHIYKMDYSKMLKSHELSKAAATIAVSNVPWELTPNFGIVCADPNGMVVSFEDKPPKPKSNLASMDIYMFNWETLKNHLFIRSIEFATSMDITKDIIPQMLMCGEQVAVYRFGDYWKDIGNIYGLWEANLELLSEPPGIDLHDDDWRIITRNSKTMLRHRNQVSSNGRIENSLVAEGVKNRGTIANSVVSAGVEIERGANVVDSVIMPGAKIGKKAIVIKTVIEADSVVGDNISVYNRL